MLTMLDLCCGLGGASSAMRDRGWRVIRVDVERDVAPDVVADVRSLPLKPFPIDLLWMSPPCTEFTRWDMGFKSVVARRTQPDLSVARAAAQLVDEWQPRFWMVENVRGSRKFLTSILGPVRAFTGGHVLYGNLPVLMRVHPSRKEKLAGRDKWNCGRAHDRRRDHLLRSKLPYEFSLDIARAVEAHGV